MSTESRHFGLSRSVLGTILGVPALLLWSTTIALGRRMTEELGIWTSTSISFLSAGVLSCLFWSVRLRTPRALFRGGAAYLWGSGGTFLVYIICLYGAIGLSADRQQVLGVGILNYLWPVLILVFSVPILGVRARPTLWLGIMLAMGGAVLASAAQGDLSWASWQRNVFAHPIPYVLALVAAFAWALHSNLTRRFGPEEGGGAQPLFVLGTGAVLLLFRWVSHEQPHWTLEGVLLLAYTAIFPVTLAYAFWDYAMRTGRIILLASLSFLAPILSTGISALFLGLTPGVTVWLACVLVIAGMGVCQSSIDEADS